MEYQEIVSLLSEGRPVVQMELEKLDEYCLERVYNEYLRLREVNPGVSFIFEGYRLESKSFSFHFITTINTLPYSVQTTTN